MSIKMTGITPARALFGKELILPIDLLFGCPEDQVALDDDYISQLEYRTKDIHR